MARQDQVIGLVASECNNFVDHFFSANCQAFAELDNPDVMKVEQKPEWFNLYQQFEAQAELTMQNALMLWGLVQAKTFEEQFVEEAMHSQALDDFLSLTDYPAFVKRMHRELQSRHQDATLPDADWLRQLSTSSRPETHWSDEAPCTMLHIFLIPETILKFRECLYKHRCNYCNSICAWPVAAHLLPDLPV